MAAVAILAIAGVAIGIAVARLSTKPKVDSDSKEMAFVKVVADSAKVIVVRSIISELVFIYLPMFSLLIANFVNF